MWVWSFQSPVSLPPISFYMPDIFVHTLSYRVHDFSCHTPPDLKITKVVVCQWVLSSGTSSSRQEGRSCFCFFSGYTFQLRIFSVVLPQTLCSFLRGGCAIGVYLRCDDTLAHRQILHMAGYPIYQNRLWANYFGHLTLTELCGTSILWRFDPHTVSDLVRAVLETCRLISPLVSGCDVILFTQPLRSGRILLLLGLFPRIIYIYIYIYIKPLHIWKSYAVN